MIEDAQGRFNLADLVLNNAVDADALARFSRLCVAAGASSSQARAIANSVLERTPKTTSPSTPASGAPTPIAPPATPNLRAITELPASDKVDGATLALLDPLVTIYSRSSKTPSSININTASEAVLTAIAPQISLSLAQAIVAKREQISYFKDAADLISNFAALSSIDPSDQAIISTQSNWFLAVGRIEHGKIDLVRQALIRRVNNGAAATLEWARDL